MSNGQPLASACARFSEMPLWKSKEKSKGSPESPCSEQDEAVVRVAQVAVSRQTWRVSKSVRRHLSSSATWQRGLRRKAWTMASQLFAVPTQLRRVRVRIMSSATVTKKSCGREPPRRCRHSWAVFAVFRIQCSERGT